MKRGRENIRDLGKIIKFNGEEYLDTWFDDECNEIKGTDGTVYPPLTEKEEGVWLHIPQLCRPFGGEYKGTSKVSGIRTNHFEVNITVPKPCFCRDPENCLPEFTFDMFPCVGIPMVLSMPHFYKGKIDIIFFDFSLNSECILPFSISFDFGKNCIGSASHSGKT